MSDMNIRLLLKDEQRIYKNLTQVLNLFEDRKKAILEKRWIAVNNIDVAIIHCLDILASELKTNLITINASSNVSRDLFTDILREEVNRAEEKENGIQVG